MSLRYELTKEKLLNFIDESQTIVFFWNNDKGWSVEYVSKNISDWGYNREDFLSGKIMYEQIIHSDDLERIVSEVEYNTKNRIDNFIQTYRIVTSDNSIKWIDDRTIIKRDNDGNVINYLGTIIDITKQKNFEEQLIESNGRFRTIIENSLMGILIYKEKFIYANQAAMEMIGYSEDELYEMEPWILMESSYVDMAKSIMLRRLAGEKFSKVYNDINFTHKDGSKIVVRMMTQTIEYEKGYAGLVSVVDITDKIKLQEKLEKQIITDSLTNILNRSGGEKALKIELEKLQRYKNHFTLIMFDIDSFKEINDNFGHQIGDYVLKEIAHIITDHIRASDNFIRWGGEEFIIITNLIDTIQIKEFAYKILRLVSDHNFKENLKVTISIGITQTKEGDKLDTILKRVDDAMYRAKHAGKNCIEYN